MFFFIYYNVIFPKIIIKFSTLIYPNIQISNENFVAIYCSYIICYIKRLLESSNFPPFILCHHTLLLLLVLFFVGIVYYLVAIVASLQKLYTKKYIKTVRLNYLTLFLSFLMEKRKERREKEKK